MASVPQAGRKRPRSSLEHDLGTRTALQRLLDNAGITLTTDVVGRGTYSSVYTAHLNDGRLVAVKAAHDLYTDATYAEELKYASVGASERAALPLLSFVNKAGCSKIFVFPYVSLTNFRFDVLNEDVGGIRRYMATLLQSLDRLHSVHSVHRDLKPKNILFDGWTAVLTDFGLTTSELAIDRRGCANLASAVVKIASHYEDARAAIREGGEEAPTGLRRVAMGSRTVSTAAAVPAAAKPVVAAASAPPLGEAGAGSRRAQAMRQALEAAGPPPPVPAKGAPSVLSRGAAPILRKPFSAAQTVVSSRESKGEESGSGGAATEALPDGASPRKKLEASSLAYDIAVQAVAARVAATAAEAGLFGTVAARLTLSSQLPHDLTALAWVPLARMVEEGAGAEGKRRKAAPAAEGGWQGSLIDLDELGTGEPETGTFQRESVYPSGDGMEGDTAPRSKSGRFESSPSESEAPATPARGDGQSPLSVTLAAMSSLPCTVSNALGVRQEAVARGPTAGGRGVRKAASDLAKRAKMLNEPHINTAGTAGFKAPEQMTGHPWLTPATDRWAAGVTMLSLLASRYPLFPGRSDGDHILLLFELMSGGMTYGLAAGTGRAIVAAPTAALEFSASSATAGLLSLIPSRRWKEVGFPAALHLCLCLLNPNPQLRPSASLLLRSHPFFHPGLSLPTPTVFASRPTVTAKKLLYSGGGESSARTEECPESASTAHTDVQASLSWTVWDTCLACDSGEQVRPAAVVPVVHRFLAVGKPWGEGEGAGDGGAARQEESGAKEDVAAGRKYERGRLPHPTENGVRGGADTDTEERQSSAQSCVRSSNGISSEV